VPTAPPELIVLDQHDRSAEFVGTTPDGRQFFLTTPFVPATERFVPEGDPGREFLALHLFDRAGSVAGAQRL
jgi:hypothetical protein